MCIIIVID